MPDKNEAIAIEEWKMSQAVIAFHSDDVFKIRGWLMSFLPTLTVSAYSHKIKLTVILFFLTIGTLTVVSFLYIAAVSLVFRGSTPPTPKKTGGRFNKPVRR